MNERMQSITIRLSPSHMRAMKARAQARNIEPARFLRSLVVDHLESVDGEDSQQALEKLARAVDDLRHRLAKATAAILTDLQTTTKEKKEARLSTEEINKWVSKYILG